jgi:hypothetical protein
VGNLAVAVLNDERVLEICSADLTRHGESEEVLGPVFRRALKRPNGGVERRNQILMRAPRMGKASKEIGVLRGRMNCLK